MTAAPTLAILIMAAGQSRRMGRDKLLLRGPDGQTMLQDRIATAMAAGHRVFVALPTDRPDRLRVVQASAATPLPCPNAAQGLGHSLSEAVRQLPSGLDGIVIMLADMPAISSDDLSRVCAAFDPDRVVRGATADRVPGHPVLVPSRFFARFDGLVGDCGAQIALKGLTDHLVPLPNKNAISDVDTLAEWKIWSNQH
ncbi:nucleotidyltransferase family protein [Aliiroseovarius sp. S1339]|uniref:nucleotidyltransferase family protein n=1 Tax=Aliiroseovarius sp. S1339 TaxID=2936990 RepID=UPI0020BF0FA0|nr:nucleotidyltransferase family protein [Aliiroseovarius sp. S1339]MCK8463586.1 nucleotidyltransferase family protein [Aliiroseovarius sp. S1339]